MNPLWRLLIATITLLSLTCWAERSDVEGRWLSGDGDGWIEVRLVGESLIGVIAGSPNTIDGQLICKDCISFNLDEHLRVD